MRASLIIFLAAGALALGGCKCGDDVHCGLGAEIPPYDFERTRIAEDLRAFPAWARYELEARPELLAEYGRGFAEGRRVEFERTSERIVNLPDTIADDFRHHGGALADTVSRGIDRASEDACCFFARTWHTIRQAIE